MGARAAYYVGRVILILRGPVGSLMVPTKQNELATHLLVIQIILVGGFFFLGAVLEAGLFSSIALPGAGLMLTGLVIGAITRAQ